MRWYYDLYSRDGRLLCMNKTAAEYEKMLMIPRERVAEAAGKGRVVAKMYRFQRSKKTVENRERQRKEAIAELLLDWEETVAPYRRVLWVQQDGPGVIRLELKGGKDGQGSITAAIGDQKRDS